VSLYNTLYPYSTFLQSVKNVKGKEQTKEVAYVNLHVLKLVCKELNISFRRAWIKLSEIEDAWHG
jgi:hypothetical protein